ncbi:MAG: DEAD/DEAH box helicase, partial [SAR202 cluster bacterium]|nr:DEAD/DEAH box helicase [SAR202 cluster bacterium]
MPLSHFHPIVQAWFRSRFSGPTEAQSAGWPAIAQGRHTLIAAPTGSGKTLAAFLTCVDGLVRQTLNGGLLDGTQVVYVSPLKALSNDIHQNLAVPLDEIAAIAAARAAPLPEIRVAVRTGDTPAAERQRMAKVPPHILITTPESLYILLTTRSGRAALSGVRTLILDEIHAIADDKRGSHLSLSVERLCALASGPVTRIGLSATQKPIEETARLLVGSKNIAPDGSPDCVIVDQGRARSPDLAVEMPGQELGPVASHELWAETLDRVAGLVREHRTTLVFVNTRKLVERVAHLLSERLGEEAVVPHHGSLSRVTRLAAEQRLKRGEVKVCVATASLELGIDIGAVDLVCQIGSPRSINVLLQRIGRSNHTLGGTPKGRLFPLTRDELVECAALLRAVRTGKLDTLRIPPWPLDVLAQQVVAASSLEEWREDALYDLVRGAYPYRDLPRRRFNQVVQRLSEGFTERRGRARAFLHRDAVNGVLRARRGAQLAAVTSGGVIPESGDYSVVADPEGTFVGTVNEDFAVESNRGDVFLLGNTPWKITRVESGRVRVQNVHGQAPSVPFWLGEAPGRTAELSQEVSAVREAVDARLDRPDEAQTWLTRECGLSSEASRQIVAYLDEGRRVLGMVPTGRRVVAERFFDESGGMQLVVHSPFGAAVNRAWGFALRKQICRTFDFELQASATDDGLN